MFEHPADSARDWLLGLRLLDAARWLPLVGVLVACSTSTPRSEPAASLDAGAVGQSPASFSREWPRQATLYAHDFLRSAITFADGSYGAAMQDGRLVNLDSEIEYGNYEANSLSVGIQGRQTGRILDLGDYRDLAKRYGYSEVVGGGVGFSSIVLDGERLLIAGRGGPPSTQVLDQAQSLLTAKTRDLDGAPAEPGHIYLIHLEDGADPSFSRLVKLLVTEHRPGETVTFLWQPLN